MIFLMLVFFFVPLVAVAVTNFRQKITTPVGVVRKSAGQTLFKKGYELKQLRRDSVF